MEGLGAGQATDADTRMGTVCNTCADAQSEPVQTHSWHCRRSQTSP